MKFLFYIQRKLSHWGIRKRYGVVVVHEEHPDWIGYIWYEHKFIPFNYLKRTTKTSTYKYFGNVAYQYTLAAAIDLVKKLENSERPPFYVRVDRLR